MKWIRILLIIALVLYTLLNLFFYFYQEKIIFLDTQLQPNHKFLFQSDFEEVTIPTEKGGSIHALHFKVDTPKGIIVYSHGNAGDLERWGNIGEEFTLYGYDVLIWDYRGYGKSTGKRSQSLMLKDAQMVYDYAKNLQSENNIVVYGRSLGTGFSTYLAANNSPSKLILETPYYSFKRMSEEKYWWVLARHFLRYPMLSNKYAQRTSCAALVLHGTQDEVVDYGYGVALYDELASTDKELVTIEGGKHNNLAAYSEYWQAFQAFLNE